MRGNDQPKGRPERPDVPGSPGQSHVTRRSLLGAAGVGAAGLAAAGAFGGLAAAAPAMAAAKPAGEGRHDRDERPGSGEHVVVHVRGDRVGELDVYSGTSHTRVQDPDLAARLRRTIR
jgi:hypothetical protein